MAQCYRSDCRRGVRFAHRYALYWRNCPFKYLGYGGLGVVPFCEFYRRFRALHRPVVLDEAKGDATGDAQALSAAMENRTSSKLTPFFSCVVDHSVLLPRRSRGADRLQHRITAFLRTCRRLAARCARPGRRGCHRLAGGQHERPGRRGRWRTESCEQGGRTEVGG